MAVPLHCRKFLHVFAKSLIPQKHWSHLVMISLTLQSDWKNVLFQQALELLKKKKNYHLPTYTTYTEAVYEVSLKICLPFYSACRGEKKKKRQNLFLYGITILCLPLTFFFVLMLKTNLGDIFFLPIPAPSQK